MTSRLLVRWPRELGFEIDVDRSGDVAAGVLAAGVVEAEAPADVEQHEAARRPEQLRQSRGGDQW